MSGKGHEVGNTVTVTFPDGKTATSKVDEKGNNYKMKSFYQIQV